MTTTIIIPARYASTRLPGKPLHKIAGQEMLLRVWGLAKQVVDNLDNVEAYVATDDDRISEFCTANNINYIMTSVDCETGTDRVLEAISKITPTPEFVVNMQGDNPFCPPWFVEEIIKVYQKDQSIEVATPVVNLSWDNLDKLRENKKVTPFSGTCVTFDKNMDAMYFSKNIIPSIRKESKLRDMGEMSPVYRQPGLYGYRVDALKKLSNMDMGVFEQLESLEQLRFMENGIKVRCVKVDYKNREELSSMSGIDSPEDVVRAEKLISSYGEL